MINVHLAGGATEKDEQTRVLQMEKIKEEIAKEREESEVIIPMLIAGDFNHDINEAKKKVDGLELRFIHDSGSYPIYDTENRVQKRERDGWSGMAIIMRSIDGIFFSEKSFEMVASFKTTIAFNKQINVMKLNDLKNRLKDKEADQTKML